MFNLGWFIKLSDQTFQPLILMYVVLQGMMKDEDLSEPIRINSISTNGNQFTLSTFQLNSLQLDNKAGQNNS